MQPCRCNTARVRRSEITVIIIETADVTSPSFAALTTPVVFFLCRSGRRHSSFSQHRPCNFLIACTVGTLMPTTQVQKPGSIFDTWIKFEADCGQSEIHFSNILASTGSSTRLFAPMLYQVSRGETSRNKGGLLQTKLSKKTLDFSRILICL